MSYKTPRLMAMLELTGDIMRTNSEAKLYQVTRAVHDLGKIAKSLHKRYENACNYQWATTDTYEKRTENLEAKAQALGEEIGITVGHQRDPRGWPLICRIGMIEHRLG
jgi:hypothetical protein